MSTGAERDKSFGQVDRMTPIDHFGVWLSGHQIRRRLGKLADTDVADLGCGFHATFARSVLPQVRSMTLVDIALSEELKAEPKVTAIEGSLPGPLKELADASFDVVMCISVLEHLWEPEATLAETRRIVRPGGVCAFSVPSWRGKRALELSAFKLGLSPAREMDDHKQYYDPRDFWPLLVRAGFVPHGIKCFTYKFGLNTFAVCRVDREPAA